MPLDIPFYRTGVHDLRRSFSQLPHDPGTAGMFGGVEVQHVTAAVADYEETVQYPERSWWVR